MSDTERLVWDGAEIAFIGLVIFMLPCSGDIWDKGLVWVCALLGGVVHGWWLVRDYRPGCGHGTVPDEDRLKCHAMIGGFLVLCLGVLVQAKHLGKFFPMLVAFGPSLGWGGGVLLAAGILLMRREGGASPYIHESKTPRARAHGHGDKDVDAVEKRKGER